jgi:hypothetical protein
VVGGENLIYGCGGRSRATPPTQQDRRGRRPGQAWSRSAVEDVVAAALHRGGHHGAGTRGRGAGHRWPVRRVRRGRCPGRNAAHRDGHAVPTVASRSALSSPRPALRPRRGRAASPQDPSESAVGASGGPSCRGPGGQSSETADGISECWHGSLRRPGAPPWTRAAASGEPATSSRAACAARWGQGVSPSTARGLTGRGHSRKGHPRVRGVVLGGDGGPRPRALNLSAATPRRRGRDPDSDASRFAKQRLWAIPSGWRPKGADRGGLGVC